MDRNLCKKCDKGCVPEYISIDSSYKYKMTVRCNGLLYESFNFEPINNKDKLFDAIKKQYELYVDETNSDYINDVLRNIIMIKNDFCPYYAEHMMSDLNHIERVKKWKNKQKKIIKIKKSLENKN